MMTGVIGGVWGPKKRFKIDQIQNFHMHALLWPPVARC